MYSLTLLSLRLTSLAVDRSFNPLKFLNTIYLKTEEGKEYAVLKQRLLEKNMKIINDRKDEHMKNPGILDDVKHISFLDTLLTVK